MSAPFAPSKGLIASACRTAITIRSVDSPAAAGKTHALGRYGVKLAARGAMVVIAQPSLVLIEQTLADLTAEARRIGRTVPIRAITSKDTTNVTRDLVEYLRTADGGQILLVTHAALMACPYWHRRQDWHLFVDEIPQVVWAQERTLPATHDLITAAIAAEPYDAAYARIVAKNRARLEQIAENRGGDEAFALVQDAAQRILSPHWEVYCLDNQYHRLLRRDDGEGRLAFFGLLSPGVFEGFAQVTIAGACFEQSLLAHLWAGEVVVKPHRVLQAALRYPVHPNGARLTIAYAGERDWSKTWRDKTVTVGGETRTVLEDVVARSLDFFGDERFAWMGNVDLADGLFGDRGTRLPNSPHGLNNFQHLHGAVVVSALNPTPAHYAFLETRGLDSEEVRTGLYRQAVYQAAARISLRDLDATAPCRIIVADRATGEWMQGLFPGSTLVPLPGGETVPSRGRVGRPRLHASDAERKAEHYAAEKRRLTEHLHALNGTGASWWHDTDFHRAHVWDDMRRDTDVLLGSVPEFVIPDGRGLRDLAGTFYADKLSARPMDYMDALDSDAFIEALRRTWQTTVPGKEAAGLYSPAIFDPSVAWAEGVDEADRTRRGLANILAIRGVWWDCDDGTEFSPDEFAKLFPRRRIVVFNTYSSTPEKPRWRAFMPCEHLVSVAVHKNIVGQMLRVINRTGWWSGRQLEKNPSIKLRRRHGLDVDKSSVPSSLFYLPCQAADPRASFFVDFDGDGREPIDAFAMVARTVAPTRPDPVPPPPPRPAAPPPVSADMVIGDIRPPEPSGMARLRAKLAEREGTIVPEDRRHKVEAAIEEWRGSQLARGNGNDAFFRLGMTQARAGVDLSDIERTLWTEASFARSPSERRGEIPRIMRVVRRSYPGPA